MSLQENLYWNIYVKSQLSTQNKPPNKKCRTSQFFNVLESTRQDWWLKVVNGKIQ